MEEIAFTRVVTVRGASTFAVNRNDRQPTHKFSFYSVQLRLQLVSHPPAVADTSN